MVTSRVTKATSRNPSEPPSKAARKTSAAPSASAPQANTRRSTRSQSREAEGNPITSRLITRPTRGVSVDDAVNGRGLDVGNGSISGRNKRARFNLRLDQDLSIVQEEDAAGYPQLPQSQADNEEEGVEPESGAATITSEYDPSEPAKLNSIVMIESLAGLFQNSTRLINLLSPQEATDATVLDLADKIRTPGTPEERLVNKVVRQFILDKDNFTAHFYIEAPIALRALANISSLQEADNGPWRPDDMLYKANISLIAVRFVLSEERDEEIENLLDDLDSLFPLPFLSFVTNEKHTQPGSSALYREHLELALEIRTQYVLSQFAKESSNRNFTPSQILQQVFYDGARLRDWNFVVDISDDGVAMRDFKKVVNRRIVDIQSCFSKKPDRPVDLDRLEELYPWSGFVRKLAVWVRHRADEIDSHLMRQGGVDEVVRSLRVEAAKRPQLTSPSQRTTSGPLTSQAGQTVAASIAAITNSQSNPMRLVEAPKSTQRLIFDSPADLAMIKSLMGQASSNPAASATRGTPSGGLRGKGLGSPVRLGNGRGKAPRSAQPRMASDNDRLFVPETQRREGNQQAGEDNEDQPLQVDDDLFMEDENHQGRASVQPSREAPPSAPPTLSQRVALILNRLKKSNAQRVKRTSESSEGPDQASAPSGRRRGSNQPASVITLEDEDPTPVRANRRNGKRPLLASSDSDEDEGFPSDDREIDETRRQQKPAPLPPSHQQEVDDVEEGASDELDEEAAEQLQREQVQQDRAEPERRARERKRRRLEREDSGSPPPSQRQYADINEEARLFTASQRNKKVQTRTPWSNEEIETLILGIAEYGTQWAKIEKWDQTSNAALNNGEGVLAKRDQVGLKDKARNMKVDYLKAGAELPENFELVPLSKKEKEKLENLGIAY